MHTNPAAHVTTYHQYVAGTGVQGKLRRFVHDVSTYVLASFGTVPRASNWIRFLYYHHVFDDERAGFASHLRYMRNWGEFISLNDAVSCLESSHSIDGRYFCITFDDGFKNGLTNAVPILLEHNATAAFFVPTKFIRNSVVCNGESLPSIYHNGNPVVEFLTWADCRQLITAGMTVGSHTITHARLIALPEAEIEREMRDSKAIIERELGVPCDHFSCPWGRPSVDFVLARDPVFARRAGYRSFLTTRRGTVHRRPSPMLIDRDHVIAAWGTYQLRYFLSR